MTAAAMPLATGQASVLHYTGYDHAEGGIMATVRNLAGENRFASMVGVAPDLATDAEFPLPTVRFRRLAAEDLSVKTFWNARGVALDARRWLAAQPNRIFHGHSRGGLAVALWLKRSGERRVVASVHSYGKQKWFYRWAARQMGDQLFWLTPAMKRYYNVKDAVGAWSQCVPPGVPVPEFPSHKVRENRRILHVGGIGSLVSWKCWHLVLDALAAMPALQRWKVRFEHVGAGDRTEKSRRYELALRTQTGALSLGNLVTWSGAESSAARLLSEIDVLVVPSMREPCSVAMLEALAAGVPVLAASSGGARDVISSTKNGWLFRSGDPHDLARALVMLAETNALDTVTPAPEPGWRFDARVVADQWSQIYARLLAAK